MRLEPIDTKLLRQIFTIIASLDRDEIEYAKFRFTNPTWEEFRENPYGSFLKMEDDGKSAVTVAINRRYWAQPS